MPISALPSRIWNSGQAAFLIEQRQADGKAVLVFVAAQAIPFMLLDVPPVTAGWNSEGFAVIDGNKVLSCRRGADKVQVLATDASFRDSRDVVMVGPDRAVVALKRGVVVVGGGHAVPVVGLVQSQVSEALPIGAGSEHRGHLEGR
jgi:hypothetical protein